MEIENLKIIGTIKKLFSFLSIKRKKQVFIALFIGTLSAFSEFTSLTAIVPLLTILIGGEENYQKTPLIKVFEYLNIEDIKIISILIIAIFAFLVCLTASMRILNIFYIGRLSAAIGNDFGSKIFCNSLYEPLETHIRRNNSIVITSLTQHINTTVNIVNGILQFITSFLISFSLIIGLFMINFKIALFTSILFTFCYLLIGYFNRRKLAADSKYITNNLSTQYRVINESLSSIRDVLLYSNQKYFLNRFNKLDRPIRKKRAEIYLLGLFPRYLIEAIALLIICLIFLLFVITNKQSLLVLPTFGAIALGCQRLLPALQQAFLSWTFVKSNLSQVKEVLKLSRNKKYLGNSKFFEEGYNSAKHFEFNKYLELKDVFFKYKDKKNFVLKNINLRINKGECIGLVGVTGSGKSTLIDIIMSLLEPTKGYLLVDGIRINTKSSQKETIGWRKCISLVPQSIFLTDNSIYENVAFGVEKKHIDTRRVREVCKVAQISEFIESLESKYETTVGEKAIKLSGGQAQRIGIARALYRRSSVLILDEATSALDNNTESRLVKSIFSYLKNVTIITIAHRLSTLKNADRVLEIKNGDLIQNDFINPN